MQSNKKQDINNHNENKNYTPNKTSNEDVTFGRSPIKTPRSVDKINAIQSRILGRLNRRENVKLERGKSVSRNNFEHEKYITTKINEVISTENDNKNDHIESSHIRQTILAPKKSLYRELNETAELNYDPESYKKKKKDWKSWSPQEKELFYEAIANGGNYSSLQKLFKNMNDKIGTKSTEKIRDYYYRALKNVNKLLRSVGDSGINRKNRDEVLHALNCYGKMITSSNSLKKSNLDAMKKLNRHPRLFKKTALSLKKLIMRGVKSMRVKKIQNNNNNNKQSKLKSLTKNVTFKKEFKINNNMNNVFPNVKIIDPDMGRKIPYDKFTLKLTPYDHDTYFRMIESNYSSRFEISIPFNKSLKQLIEILSEKWKNISKKYKSSFLYLCPLEDIWIPSEITFFCSDVSSKAFDIGDIFTAYGCPSTNVILLHYQWADSPMPIRTMSKGNIIESASNGINQTNNIIIDNNTNINLNSNLNFVDNSLLAQPTLNLENSARKESDDSQLNMEDVLNSANSGNDSEDDKEKSFIALDQDYDEFDPLEFLGIYKSKGNFNLSNLNSSDGDLDGEYDINKIWDDDEFCEIDNMRNISPSNESFNINDNPPDTNTFNMPNLPKERNLPNLPNITNVTNTNNPHQKDQEHDDANDPYKRVNYFNKIRNGNKKTNLNLSDSFNSSSNNVFIKNLNNNVKSNLFSISESDSNVHSAIASQDFSKILNFQDLGSKMKSNTISLSCSNTNILNEKSKQPVDNLDGNNQEKSNENSCSANEMKNSKRRINFQNNFNNINNQNEKKSENRNNEESKPKSLTPKLNKTSIESSKNNIPNSNFSNHNSENNLNFSFFNSLSKSRNFENYLNNISSSNLKDKVNSSIAEKQEITNFNAENSNIFNNTNYNHIGIFDQESNFNLMKNYNNSMLFGDNMFNSNHLNTNFIIRNMEDTMMKRITSSFEPMKNSKEREGNINFSNLNLIQPDTSTANIKDNTVSIPSEDHEKEKETEILLNKKSKRKNEEAKSKKNKNSRRNTPLNLDEVLDVEARDNKMNKSSKSKNKKKNGSEKNDMQVVKNSINKNQISTPIYGNNNNFPNYNNIPHNHHISHIPNNFNQPFNLHNPSAHNINISNANPYIINQNNFFNSYNPNGFNLNNPMYQRVFHPQFKMNNKINVPASNIDIPHPNSLISPSKMDSLAGINPVIHSNEDPNMMYNNRMNGHNGSYNQQQNPRNIIPPPFKEDLLINKGINKNLSIANNLNNRQPNLNLIKKTSN